MLRPALTLLLGLAAVASVSATAPAEAQSFDPKHCSAIRNVDVPYEISREGASIVFTRGGERIVVSDQAITVGAARLEDPALASAYAGAVRRFMGASARFPIVAAAFGQSAAADRRRAQAETPGFLGAMRDMCQSLLEVSEVQSRIKRAFPAFNAPIRVTLGG